MARFVDTSVLLYAVSRAHGEATKRRQAEALLESRNLVLSVQVLQEFYGQATRAGRRTPMAHGLAVEFMRSWRRFPVVDVTTQVMDLALRICHEHRLAYWDAAIVAAAGLAGCDEVLTEDMHSGAVVGGVRIRNPFA